MSIYNWAVAVLFVIFLLMAVRGFATWRRGGSKQAYAGALFTVLLGNILLTDRVSPLTQKLIFIPSLLLLAGWFLYNRRKDRQSHQRSP